MTQSMHMMLFAANFLYVFYELQYSYIHLYFAMIFCTDICGVWGVYLIVKGNGGEINGAAKFLYIFVTFVLIAIFFGAWMMPEHGLRCHKHYPIGLTLIICFYVFWSAYVCHKLRDPTFLAAAHELSEEEIKTETEEMEKLPISERPFNKVAMVRKQKKNFMFSTIACLLAQVLLIGTSLLGLYLHDGWSDLLESDCINDGWGMRDSTIHLLLTNVMISLPIWQFIECFYSIPLEHGYFNEGVASKRDNFEKLEDTEMTTTNN